MAPDHRSALLDGLSRLDQELKGTWPPPPALPVNWPPQRIVDPLDELNLYQPLVTYAAEFAEAARVAAGAVGATGLDELAALRFARFTSALTAAIASASDAADRAVAAAAERDHPRAATATASRCPSEAEQRPTFLEHCLDRVRQIDEAGAAAPAPVQAMR